VKKLIQGKAMKPDYLEIRNTLEECPKCGKHSLAQRGHDKYQCLWCGFYRDISEPQWGNIVVMAAIFVVVLIVSLAYQPNSPTPELSSPDASNIPVFKVSPEE
jgi:ribosomal protein L37E